jgi:Zn-dependent protease with chaperone function
VSERGRLRARLADRGHRFLVLGVGVLPGLSQQQLSAILAHEYGHFSNRDTAGGDVAGAVLASLVTAVVGIARGGGANVLNPAWHFLRTFLSLFQRITLGAKRLQEVLADRFAIRTYGGRTFSEGLRHVVDRSIRFGRESDQLIAQAHQTRLAIASLYVPPAAPAPGLPDLDKMIVEAVNEPGSPYDSHPPVSKRLAWAAALTTGDDDTGPRPDASAWDLFPDRAALEAQMTSLVNEHLQRSGAIDERPLTAVQS